MTQIFDLLGQELNSALPEPAKLNRALRLLAKHRSQLIQLEVIRKYGTDVIAGPFKGMHFIEASAEGCHIPKLLGCYEQELHGFIATIVSREYANILNIGCAEGYYAVGFKKLVPDARVIACDTSSRAQQACAELARRNEVSLDIRGTFTPDDFAAYEGETLVWCDIEGGEADLLDPVKAPALQQMEIVVELHPSVQKPEIASVPDRFKETHNVAILWPRVGRSDLPELFRSLGHLDQLLAIWEWRSTPTPWAIMLPKAAA
jgi:hypothetical protein